MLKMNDVLYVLAVTLVVTGQTRAAMIKKIRGSKDREIGREEERKCIKML
jgi:hypothetical protein